MEKRLNSSQVIKRLKESSHNYIQHYFQGASIYDDEGNEQGQLTQKVLDNLITSKKIIHVANSDMFHSNGYYKLIQTP